MGSSQKVTGVKTKDITICDVIGERRVMEHEAYLPKTTTTNMYRSFKNQSPQAHQTRSAAFTTVIRI